ncbi:MAG: hypothetical protein DI601_09695 [Azospirillum brasilense]|nr:MAG: hypothetical protein DI601_09695 [Azospirillum brasilense]
MLQISGQVPGTILENSGAGDWSARLTLSDSGGLATGVLAVALTGAGAGAFSATLDAASQTVTITPARLLDREAWAAGADPVLAFGLRVQTADGWQDLGSGWAVTLLGVDDTPPSGLAFSSGGSVLETDAGGIVGSLTASDPDSAAAQLTFTVAPQDDWRFEVVDGNVLKLRDGYDLLRSGGTALPVAVIVSDGHQDAAMTVDVAVLNVTSEDDTPAPPVLRIADASMAEGDSGSGTLRFAVSLSRAADAPVTLRWNTVSGTATAGQDFQAASGQITIAAGASTASIAVTVLGDRLREADESFRVVLTDVSGAVVGDGEASGTILNDDRPTALAAGGWVEGVARGTGSVAVVEAAASGSRLGLNGSALELRLAGGALFDLGSVRQVDFMDGQLELAADSAAAQATRLYQTLLLRDPDAGGLALHTHLLESGALTRLGMARSLLSSPEAQSRFGTLSDTDLVTRLYAFALGRTPDAGGMATHLNALARGMERAQLVLAFTTSPEATARYAASHPGGTWVVDSTAREILYAYDAVLDEVPDAASLARWEKAIAAGTSSLTDLYRGLMKTQAYLVRHPSGESEASFLARLFADALERAPSAADLTNWHSMIASHGWSNLDLLMLIGRSGEAMAAFTAPAVASGALTTELPAPDTATVVRLSPGGVAQDIAFSTAGVAVLDGVSADASHWIATPKGLELSWEGDTLLLSGAQSVRFDDGRLDLGSGTSAAWVVRLYETILMREPDASGLATHAARLDAGLTPAQLAADLVGSAEFASRFGALSTAQQVSAFYRGALGRSAAASEIDYHVGLVTAGMSKAALAAGIAGSVESRNLFLAQHPQGIWLADPQGAKVARAYEAVLDSGPDASSLLLWSQKLAAGTALRDLYAELMQTELFTARHGGQDDSGFIADLYGAALGRGASAGEIANWSNWLKAGHSRLDLAYAIGESGEAQSHSHAPVVTAASDWQL